MGEAATRAWLERGQAWRARATLLADPSVAAASASVPHNARPSRRAGRTVMALDTAAVRNNGIDAKPSRQRVGALDRAEARALTLLFSRTAAD